MSVRFQSTRRLLNFKIPIALQKLPATVAAAERDPNHPEELRRLPQAEELAMVAVVHQSEAAAPGHQQRGEAQRQGNRAQNRELKFLFWYSDLFVLPSERFDNIP